MTGFDFVAEVFGDGTAAPASGAGRPPQPPAPPTSPEALAGFVAAWLLRIGCNATLPAAGPALRVAIVVGHREAAGHPPVGGRELAAFIGQRTAEDGLRGLRIGGLVRMEPRADGGRGVVYRPTGGHKPAKGPLGDVRRLNWLRRAATDVGRPDLAVRLALLAGSAWPWETPTAPPEASGLAARLGCTADEITAAWAGLAERGLIRFNRAGDHGLDGDGRLLVRVTYPRGSDPAEDGA